MKMAIQATQMYKNDTLTPPSTIHTHTPPHPHPQYTHTHCLFHKEHKQNNRLKLSNIICYAFSSFFHFLFWFLYSFSLFFHFFFLLFFSFFYPYILTPSFIPLFSFHSFYVQCLKVAIHPSMHLHSYRYCKLDKNCTR